MGEAGGALDDGSGEAAAAQLAERGLRAGPCGADGEQLRAGALVARGGHRDVGLVVAVLGELVDDAEGELEAVEARRVGGQDLQPARERGGRLEAFAAAAQLQVADVDLVGHARVETPAARDAPGERGLVAGGGDDEGARVGIGDDVEQREGGGERRLAVAARDGDDNLGHVGIEQLGSDAALPMLQVEAADDPAEQGEVFDGGSGLHPRSCPPSRRSDPDAATDGCGPALRMVAPSGCALETVMDYRGWRPFRHPVAAGSGAKPKTAR